MKKYLLLALFSAIPFQAFCYQMTRTCNSWDVQNQVSSLENWGCTIYSVRCDNPYADMRDQRWTIVYDQK